MWFARYNKQFVKQFINTGENQKYDKFVNLVPSDCKKLKNKKISNPVLKNTKEIQIIKTNLVPLNGEEF